MTTYTDLADANVAQDKPGTQSLFRALRDNPIAIAEGATGAPRVSPKAVTTSITKALCGGYAAETYAANGIIAFTTVQVDTFGWLLTPFNKFQPNIAGTYRVILTCKTSNTSQSMAFSKNGVAIGETANAGLGRLHMEEIVTLNGTTDYIQVIASGPSPSTNPSGFAAFTAELIGVA